MQCTARVSTKRVAGVSGVARPRVAPLRVVCKAQTTQVSEVAKKAAAAATSAATMFAASPAFALVDERLNGDGTGLPFGINDGILGWCMFGVFSTIWALYFISQKDYGDFEDPDAGLRL